jgi:hypothetical protein
MIMTLATMCIALLPNYASIGIFAPLLLLFFRMIQGFSASGEYAGASNFLAEYAPKNKKGLYTSLVPASTAAGLLLGSLMSAAMFAWMSESFLYEYGWRIPFLLAAPLGLIGRFIRLKLEDTPEFLAHQKTSHKETFPIKALFTEYRQPLFKAFAIASLNATAFYLIFSYMPNYLSTELGVNKTESFISGAVSLAFYIGTVFIIGKYYDKQMPFWSYGNRLYVNIYPNKTESTEEKIQWLYGPYRNTTKKTYSSFGQSWPRFRKDIYITSKMMILDKKKYEEQFTDEEKYDIKNNESLRELHKIKYKETDFWGDKFGKDVYWCSLDLSKFYPNTPTSIILKNFKSFGVEIEKKFNDFDSLLLLIESILAFEINYEIGTHNSDFQKIGLNENEIKFNGIPTGLFGAGFLANIAMLGVDKALNKIIELDAKTEDKIAIFRYVDDFTILGQTFS